MQASLALVAGIILIALLFDHINGFHDAANSIATVVSTRVLTPMQALAWMAVFTVWAWVLTIPMWALAVALARALIHPMLPRG